MAPQRPGRIPHGRVETEPLQTPQVLPHLEERGEGTSHGCGTGRCSQVPGMAQRGVVTQQHPGGWIQLPSPHSSGNVNPRQPIYTSFFSHQLPAFPPNSDFCQESWGPEGTCNRYLPSSLCGLLHYAKQPVAFLRDSFRQSLIITSNHWELLLMLLLKHLARTLRHAHVLPPHSYHSPLFSDLPKHLQVPLGLL